MRLQDQVILITGSTTGIGAAMARRFVTEGARVILHGRDTARGEALRQELGPLYTVILENEGGEQEHIHRQIRKGLWQTLK